MTHLYITIQVQHCNKLLKHVASHVILQNNNTLGNYTVDEYTTDNSNCWIVFVQATFEGCGSFLQQTLPCHQAPLRFVAADCTLRDAQNDKELQS